MQVRIFFVKHDMAVHTQHPSTREAEGNLGNKRYCLNNLLPKKKAKNFHFFPKTNTK